MPLELFAFGPPRPWPGSAPRSSCATSRAAPTAASIADYRGEIGDPAALAARLEADPGVAAHGLFPPEMVSEVLIGRGEKLERLGIRDPHGVRDG